MNDKPLKDKVAIVTGASRGIGEAIALALGRAGAAVVVNCAQSVEAAGRVAAMIQEAGTQSIVLAADVSDGASVRELVQTTLTRLGQVDILVNNAAAFLLGVSLADTSQEDWDRLMAVNLRGPFLTSQAVARHMMERRSGAIINISSMAAQCVLPGYTAYCASKGGLESLTRAMAAELAPFNIRVNAIAPGHMATELNLRLLAADEACRRRFQERVGLGRLGHVEEIGDLVVCLASDAGGFIVGQTIVADGGVTNWQGPLI